MYVREILPNGVRLLSVPSSETRAFTLLVLVGTGSRYESLKLGGAAHFLEHMLFKGTKRWPSAARISRALDAVGADYNAFTSKEYTGYYVRALADRAELAVDMLHEMVARPLFDPKEVERERGVILEEIAMYEDMPSAHASELLDGLLYSCPIGRNIAGTRGSVSGLSRADLRGFWKDHYRPAHMVVTAAGDIDDEVLRHIRKVFGSISRGKSGRRKVPCAKMPTGRKARVAMKVKDGEQVQFALGLPGLPYRHRMRPALALMAAVLGGGMSSRLFTEVRERRGLAYSVYASTSAYSDAGDFSIHAGLAKDKAEKGIRTVMQELARVARSGVKPSELKRAKAYLEGRMVLALESTHELAEFYAKQELLNGGIRTVDERIKAIDAVTADQVHAVAKRLLRQDRLSASVVGPFEGEHRLRKLLTLT